jgi:hypothetical protein
MHETDETASSGLSDRDEAILLFERDRPRHDAAKEEAIRVQFGVSSARYYQLVDTLILRPEALRADPLLVSRLLRLREGRVARRAARSGLRRSASR